MIYRAYYAFIRSPRINTKGVNTSAAFGFVNTFIDLLQKNKPDYIAVAFDTSSPTFRHQEFTDYKANRDAQPEGISVAVPYIKEFLRAMRVPIVECAGYEADDVVGTLANRLSPEADTVFLFTPDKDYAQLVRGNIRMLKPQTGGGGAENWGVPEVCEHFGVTDPLQVIDLLGLWGDASDNIPGCPGVGEKKAKELLASYGSIDGIYDNIDSLKGKTKENFVTYRDQILLSRRLATIVTDAPVEFDIEAAKLTPPDSQALRQLFAELEFKNMMPRIDQIFNAEQPIGGLFADLGGLFAQPGVEVDVPAQSTLKTAQDTDHDYKALSTDDELKALAQRMEAADRFCFDTETTSVSTIDAAIVGLSVAFEPHTAYYIPFGPDEVENKRRLQFFASAFASTEVLKIGQNMKFDIEVLANYDIAVGGPMFDTMIAHFLLYPGRRHNMDEMAETLLQYKPIEIESLIGKGAKQKSMADVDLKEITEYAAEDADVTLQLFDVLRPQINASADMARLMNDIEMPLVSVLAKMERNGVRLDEQAIGAFAEHLRQQIGQSEAKIYEYAGTQFNIGSPKQVGEVLFEQMKIDAKAKKTKTGQYATNEETLQKLAHDNPIVAEILNYRGLIKLLNTYAEALPKLVNAKTQRIHTSYNQTVVITGRLSSSNPNLQNIPIRDDNGKEIRKTFVASEGNVLLAADYSQVELRLMAHFSGDEHLIRAFCNGEDIHAATAAKIYGVPLSEVTSDMRRTAKTANFGIIYGISAFGLAERLDIPRREAQQIIDGYFQNFPQVREYMDRSIDEAKASGAVRTLFGRKRELEDINSRNSVVRSVAERNAINAPIQGTAADIIKIAMINIDKAMVEAGLRSKMILQVHDELVFDCPTDELDMVRSIVVSAMEGACQLSVPLVAEVGTGHNWLEAH